MIVAARLMMNLARVAFFLQKPEYNEWGATAKAERLSRHCRFDIESRSAELKSSRFARGKSNFDIRTSEQHKSAEFY